MTSRPILPTPLVSTDWLAKHLGDPDLRVLDATAHLAGPESGGTVGWSLRPGLTITAPHTFRARRSPTSSAICPSPTGARSASLPRRGSRWRPAGWASARSLGRGLRARRALGDRVGGCCAPTVSTM